MSLAVFPPPYFSMNQFHGRITANLHSDHDGFTAGDITDLRGCPLCDFPAMARQPPTNSDMIVPVRIRRRPPPPVAKAGPAGPGTDAVSRFHGASGPIPGAGASREDPSFPTRGMCAFGSSRSCQDVPPPSPTPTPPPPRQGTRCPCTSRSSALAKHLLLVPYNTV
ncbi:hypothetical protein IBTHAUMO2_1070004 [Nitrosopumilaceae archaeon]|nr:hypothetical protein IBTHAUMO2_1070004 [Nitrosopumilaceae archaeon]